jgi:acetamidase/formamidase
VLSIISLAADFGITQVADGNFGVHATISKDVFAATRQPA